MSPPSPLNKFLEHNDTSFHFFTDEEAKSIASKLVEWYKVNRRKLPWRGDKDVMNLNGSTSGLSETRGDAMKRKKQKKRKRGGNDGIVQADAGVMERFVIVKRSNNNSSEKVKKAAAYSSRSSQEDKQQQQLIQSNQKEEQGPNNYDTTTTITGVEGDDQRYNINMEQQEEVTPYGVWVSEIMLQQTRVEAVIPYYIKWMKSFPTVEALANAAPEEVNSHWAGLGFYRRARNLHAGAKYVVEECDGILPSTVEGLMKVNGIGRYTASAVASIAHGVRVPVVDGNVCRVLSRLRGIANNIKAPALKDRIGWDLAQQLIDATDNHPGDVNQALMELGATYCSPAGSGVDNNDPLKEFYLSTQIGRDFASKISSYGNNFVLSVGASREHKCKLCASDGIERVFFDLTEQITKESLQNENDDFASLIGHAVFPVAPPKKAKREEIMAVAVICDDKGRWLMSRRPPKGLLAGQWEFPMVCVSNEYIEVERSTRKRALVKHFQSILDISHENDGGRNCIERMFESSDDLNKGKSLEHVFSHIRHTLWLERVNLVGSVDTPDALLDQNLAENIKWMTEADMLTLGITSECKKVLGKAKI